MPTDSTPREGSLIVAALIILGLVFGGHWIISYVNDDANPWAIVPWYGMVAVVIVLFGIVRNSRSG
jgi:hypothetical protein